MPKRKLEGKNVVITGGGGGLGSALGYEFSLTGANVALLDVDYEATVLAADRISEGTALAIECDVTDPDACRSAIATVAAFRLLASWIRAEPTPPEAPVISTTSPSPTPARRSMFSAVV